MEFNQIMFRTRFGQYEEEGLNFANLSLLTNCLCANSNHVYSSTVHISPVIDILLDLHRRNITSMFNVYATFL